VAWIKGRWRVPDLKRAVQWQHDLYDPSVIVIEDAGSGIQLRQEMHEMGLPVVPYKSRLNKTMRFAAQIGAFKDGHFYVVEPADWSGPFLHEMLTFPASRFDDQVDAIAIGLEWISLEGMRKPAGVPLQLAHEIVYGQGATQAAHQQSAGKVLMIAPPEVSNYHPLGGVPTPIGVDRKVWVTRDVVPALVAAFWKLA